MQSIAENSESQDDDNGEQSDPRDNVNININSLPSQTASSGYYDAEKCRAHIARQSRVNKILRFSSQIIGAVEIESLIGSRLSSILDMYTLRSCHVTYDFSAKCKFGTSRHREDRILNQPKKHNPGNKRGPAQAQKGDNSDQNSINNDLLYGEGAKLVQELLVQPLKYYPPKQSRRRKVIDSDDKKGQTPGKIKNIETDASCVMASSFEPRLYVLKLEESIRDNLRASQTVAERLEDVKRLFERLVTEHHDRFEMVYALEEERQASTIVRRSTYNLNSKIALPARTLIVPDKKS